MIYTIIYTQSDIKRMRDKQALMGVSRKWRIMYLWHMYPYSTKHTLVSLICNYVIEM